MTVQSNFSKIRGVRLEHLILSPLNVRKKDGAKAIPGLANSIKVNGVLQNVVGYEEEPIRGKRFIPIAVTAGGQRWRACQRLLKEGAIKKDYIVPCLVTSKEAAVAISLAENSDREPLHPADEFEAARALVDAGSSIDDVAARLHLTPLVVKQRLKLANVAPEFIQLYRDDKLNLEQLMAFAITDDHERQRQVWKGLSAHSRSAHFIREALTQNEVCATDPLARFVGVHAYEKAGGHCRRDLFNADNEIFFQDVELLNRLAQAKLDKCASKLKEEGHAWVETTPRSDHAHRAQFVPVSQIEREPNKKERVKLESFDAKLAAVEAAVERADGDEEKVEALDRQWNELDEAKNALRDSLLVPNPEEQARAGAVVSIGGDGKPHIVTGLLKREDVKSAAHQARADETEDKGPRTHSATLLQRLTAHRTLALRAEFAQNPDVAFSAMVHKLALTRFYDTYQVPLGPLQVHANEKYLQPFAKDLDTASAGAWLAKQFDDWKAKLPADPKRLFPWILERSMPEKLALLAFCTAPCVDAVQNNEEASDAEPLARALGMDIRKWWRPTAESYYNSVPKAAILAAVAEGASAKAASGMEKLAKKLLAQQAENTLVATSWLPSVMRGAWAAEPSAPPQDVQA